MSMLDRRVQILISSEQYDHLEHEATRSGRSVAALIRAAIDDRLARQNPPRRAAADSLLASSDSAPDHTEEDWLEVKAALATDTAARYS